jgi:hypothetical protein
VLSKPSDILLLGDEGGSNSWQGVRGGGTSNSLSAKLTNKIVKARGKESIIPFDEFRTSCTGYYTRERVDHPPKAFHNEAVLDNTTQTTYVHGLVQECVKRPSRMLLMSRMS